MTLGDAVSDVARKVVLAALVARIVSPVKPTGPAIAWPVAKLNVVWRDQVVPLSVHFWMPLAGTPVPVWSVATYSVFGPANANAHALTSPDPASERVVNPDSGDTVCPAVIGSPLPTVTIS